MTYGSSSLYAGNSIAGAFQTAGPLSACDHMHTYIWWRGVCGHFVTREWQSCLSLYRVLEDFIILDLVDRVIVVGENGGQVVVLAIESRLIPGWRSTLSAQTTVHELQRRNRL